LLVVVALNLTTNSIGLTYDEPNYISASDKAITWAATFWRGVLAGDFSAASPSATARYWRQNSERPGFIKLWWGFWLRRAVFAGPLGQARFGTTLLVGLLAMAMYLHLRPHFGRAAACFAPLLLVTTPRFFFHSHLAALDAPVASFCFITAAAAWRLWQKPSWAWTVAAGLTFGMALGTKGNAFPTVAVIVLWALLFCRKSLGRTLVAVCAVGPALFWLTWPWLWPAPVSRFLAYMGFHEKFPLLGAYLFGRMYERAPFYTPLVALLTTSPVAVLALPIFSARSPRGRLPLYYLLHAAAQVAFFTLPSAPKFNGERLFLPAFPFIAALAAIGLVRLGDLIGNRLSAASVVAKRYLTLGIAGVVLGLNLRCTILAHPFELAFYNSLVGGAPGARKLGLETIYWGNAYLNILPFLNERVPPGGSVYVTPVGCMSVLETYQRGGALRPDINILGGPHEHLRADYVVFQCQQSEFLEVAWRLYRAARPAFSLSYSGVPVMLAYNHASVLRAEPQGRPPVGEEPQESG